MREEQETDASIVIPVKNGGERLNQVLDMINRQETEFSYEVICVDSGSGDDSVETIKRHGCILKQIPPEEFGHGKTRNLGASLWNRRIYSVCDSGRHASGYPLAGSDAEGDGKQIRISREDSGFIIPTRTATIRTA